MGVDHGADAGQETRRQAQQFKALATSETGGGGGDSSHAGSGFISTALGDGAVASGAQAVALGPNAEATQSGAVALGPNTTASGQNGTAVGTGATAADFAATAVGQGAYAGGEYSIALGRFADASYDNSVAIGHGVTTTATNQIRLGSSGQTVVVDGTFSNPSARRLKRNIIPAPSLTDVFPELVEYEYIDGDGRRRIGYIADDLIGTGAERFVTYDDGGNVAGIEPLGLMMAQIAAMHARVTELENLMGESNG